MSTERHSTSLPVVIAGAGLAGFAVAREFRKRDATTPVIMASADEASYYSKPALSNALKAGAAPAALVLRQAEAVAEELHIDIWPRSPLECIDPGRRKVQVNDREVAYGKLVLAVGADPVAPAVDGDAAGEIHQVNDLADYARFRMRLEGARHVLIVGAGLVGCEFANDIASTGVRVTCVDLFDYPLARFCPPECGEAVRASLAAIGVEWRLSSRVRRLDRQGAALVATLAEGDAIECDVVLAAVGLRPRVAVAAAAGLKLGRGITADACLRTSAEDVFAIGDCSEVNGELRPFVMPIMAGARALAISLGGRATPVDFGHMPVIVKTPACPAVLLPPPQSCEGEWQVDGGPEERRAVFQDATGAVRGFALIGAATRQRQALLRSMAGASDRETPRRGMAIDP
jgi:rubredoxin-NAD+ reductase